MNGVMAVPHVFPVSAPLDHGTTGFGTSYVNAGLNEWLTFVLYFGASTDNTSIDITVESSSANSSNSSEEAIPFWYALTSATGTDTIGATTAATTTGYTSVAGTTVANKAVRIDVDPQSVDDDKPYVRVWVALNGGTYCLMSAVALLHPRYQQAIPPASS